MREKSRVSYTEKAKCQRMHSGYQRGSPRAKEWERTDEGMKKNHKHNTTIKRKRRRHLLKDNGSLVSVVKCQKLMKHGKAGP